MSAKMLESHESLFPSTSRLICIVGPRRLQNELIATGLERETGSTCRVNGDINHIPSSEELTVVKQPRLVLCDYQGVDLKGLLIDLRSSTTQKLARDHVALFNVSRGRGIEEQYVWEGVRGVFYEQDPWDQFLKGVRAILAGELWLPREVMSKCILEGRVQESSCEKTNAILTAREVEILALVAVGARNDEIADKLCISAHTVKTHLYNIFKKIDVPNRLQAALWAAKNL
ncbi:MAG: DNA-binding response regulator [Deltaproteobacteria bacterium]|nr:MAG: DNA-binding response regulator [Deltaproteobacteria bacterium]